MTTKDIVDEFMLQIDADKEYNLQDLKKVLADIYKTKTAKKVEPVKRVPVFEKDAEYGSDDDKPKKRGRPPSKPKLDKNGEVKVKKAPSAYNNFIRVKMNEIKQEHIDDEVKKTARELMLEAASQWKLLTKQEQEGYKDM